MNTKIDEEAGYATVPVTIPIGLYSWLLTETYLTAMDGSVSTYIAALCHLKRDSIETKRAERKK